MIVYVIGQLMFYEYGRHYMQRKLLPALRATGADVMQPVSLVGWEVGSLSRKDLSEADQMAFWEWLNARVRAAIRAAIDRADVIVAVLDGDEPHRETLAEMRYASSRLMPIFGFLNDIRYDAYNEKSPTYPQADRLVKLSGQAIYKSLPMLTEALKQEREDRQHQTMKDAEAMHTETSF